MESTNSVVCENEMERDIKEIHEKYKMYFDMEKKNMKLKKELDDAYKFFIYFTVFIGVLVFILLVNVETGFKMLDFIHSSICSF